MTTLHIRRIQFMNILFLSRLFASARNQRHGNIVSHIQIQNHIGTGNTELFIFKILCPVHEIIPFITVKLGKLMDLVGGGIACCNDHAVGLFVKFLPIPCIRGKAVNRIKRGCGIGVHVAGTFAEFTRKIHSDECGGFARIIRERNHLDFSSLRAQFFGKDRRLGGFT